MRNLKDISDTYIIIYPLFLNDISISSPNPKPLLSIHVEAAISKEAWPVGSDHWSPTHVSILTGHCEPIFLATGNHNVAVVEGG